MDIKLTPLRVYLIWIGLCLLFALLIPVLGANSDSSAQAPFMLGVFCLIMLICGTFLISIFNMFFFKKWFKRFWYINGSIMLITGGVILYFVIRGMVNL